MVLVESAIRGAYFSIIQSPRVPIKVGFTILTIVFNVMLTLFTLFSSFLINCVCHRAILLLHYLQDFDIVITYVGSRGSDSVSSLSLCCLGETKACQGRLIGYGRRNGGCQCADESSRRGKACQTNSFSKVNKHHELPIWPYL